MSGGISRGHTTGQTVRDRKFRSTYENFCHFLDLDAEILKNVEDCYVSYYILFQKLIHHMKTFKNYFEMSL